MDFFLVLMILIICKSWLGKKKEEERIAKCLLSSILDKRNNTDVIVHVVVSSLTLPSLCNFTFVIFFYFFNYTRGIYGLKK